MMSAERTGRITITALAALSLATVGCQSSTTEPLPDLSFDEGRATVGDTTAAGSDSTVAPSDSTGTPGDTTSTGATPLPAEEIVTLYASSHSGITEEGQQTVVDVDAWVEVWGRIHATVSPAPPAPEVDFAEQRVLVFAAGTRPNGGHRLELGSVTSDAAGLTVLVKDVVPGPGCLTTQEITNPVLALALPASPDGLVISVERVYDECS
jgi:hypothetical protein